MTVKADKSGDLPRHIEEPLRARQAGPGPGRLRRSTGAAPFAMTRVAGLRAAALRIGFRAAMRFYEYEARKIVELAGIPVTKYGFCTTADEAREAAEEIGGPVVIKSQVLSGGRMKAGGVKFADTPDEAAEHAEAILELEINGHMPRGVLVDPKAEVKQEYYAERRLGRHREAAADAVQRHGRDRHRGGRRDPPRPRRPRPRLQPPPDLRLRGQAGDRRDRRHRLAAEPGDPDPRQARPPLPRQRHDPGRDQPAGRADRRQLRRPRRPHGDGERGGRPPEEACSASSWRSPRTTPARPTSPPTSSATSPRSTPPTTAA